MAQHPRTAVRAPGSGTATPSGTSGSQTVQQLESDPSTPSATLRLRAEPEERRHIRWAEGVVNNEGMGKKSSKVCCIYHKPRESGDSDSESDSSSSDSDSESAPDLSRAQNAGGKTKRKCGGRRHGDDGAKDKAKDRKPSPNAYERQAKHKGKQGG